MIIFVAQNFFMDAVAEKLTFQNKIKMYMIFIKFRLSALIIISALSGYLFVGGNDGYVLTYLLIGGLLVTGASNGYNQIWERDLDKLMERTKKRPIPQGNMSVKEGYAVVVFCLLIGTALLYLINIYSAMLGLFAFGFYVYIYTPLKRITSLAVLVGAIPGAIPPMLGAIACTGEFGLIPGILFFVQFMWQFPHFWAIGWFLFEDYKRGGFFMLPTGKQDRGTAVQTIMYTIWTILISIVPVLGITGELKLSIVAAIIVFLLGLGMLYYALQLFKKMTEKAAKQLMLSSVFYISLIQIVYVLDKFIR